MGLSEMSETTPSPRYQFAVTTSHMKINGQLIPITKHTLKIEKRAPDFYKINGKIEGVFRTSATLADTLEMLRSGVATAHVYIGYDTGGFECRGNFMVTMFPRCFSLTNDVAEYTCVIESLGKLEWPSGEPDA
jgi:hypothetical protein